MTDKPSSLAAALAEFQSSLPKIAKTKTAKVRTKDGNTYEYNYADLADVTDSVVPRLGRFGLSWSAKPTTNERGDFVLAYRLKHVSGDEDSGEWPLPSPASVSPQAMGSAISYARRYALSAVTGVAPDIDDDGKTADEHRDSWESAKPAERYDESPTARADREATADGFEQEIAGVKTPEELSAVSKNLLAAKRRREITKAQYDRLAILGGQRRGELNGASEQVAVPEQQEATA